MLDGRKPTGVRDLLELPAPGAVGTVGVREGRRRLRPRVRVLRDPVVPRQAASRTPESIEAEARALVEAGVAEIVLVAQDLAWYGRDAGEPGALAPLLRRLDALAPTGLDARPAALPLSVRGARPARRDDARARRPSCPYFDLSLQHASAGLLRRMKRWGSGDRFLAMIDDIRAEQPDAAFRSSFIVGFPGETEADHDELLAFLDDGRARLGRLLPVLRGSRHRRADAGRRGRRRARCTSGCASAARCRSRSPQAARGALVGATVEVLVDGVDDETVLVGRTHREAPEIDGVVRLDGGPTSPDPARPSRPYA